MEEINMCFYERKEEGLIIRTPYKNNDFVTEVKKLGGRWSPEEKCWTIDREKEEEAIRITERFFRSEPVSLKEYVDRAVSDSALYSGDTVDRLVAFAYFYGRESATKEVSDEYRKLIRDMKGRALRSRYSNLILDTIGERNYIPFKDYSGKVTEEMGKLKTEI